VQSETFEGGDDQQDAGSPCAERISRAFGQEAGAEAGVNHKRETPRSSQRGSTGGSTILSDSEGTTTPSTSDGARKVPPAMVVSSTQMLQHNCRTLLV